MKKLKPSAIAAESGSDRPLRLTPIALAIAAALSAPLPVYADNLPTGLQTLSGKVTVATPTATSMTLNQATQNASMSAQSFSIGFGNRVDITQPAASSVLMMNVVGNNPSNIFGTLTANGQFFLTNSAGVLFGPTASVSVGGLVASTMPISFADATSGHYVFANSGNSAGVTVQAGAQITALNGYVGLFAPNVVNEGLIVARMGTVALAAGNQVTLDMVGDGLIKVSVDTAALNASAMNRGTIQADGGNVLLTARSANALLDTVINTDGVIRANTINNRNGTITLDGGSAGVVSVGGALEAKGNDAGSTGGTVKILGEYVGVGLSNAAASVDVSGDAGGGTVLIGGNFQGRGLEQNALRTVVGANASISSDAMTTGNGGRIIVWSDEATRFSGGISAKGGVQGGDGGFVEVSGKSLAFNGSVTTSAPHGRIGSLLLDPDNIIVVAGGAETLVGTTSDGSGTTLGFNEFNTAQSDTFHIDPTYLAGLNATVTLQAVQNLTITDAVNLTAPAAGFIGQAGNNIVLNNSITTNGGVINLTANDATSGAASGAGSITGGGALTSAGSNATATTGGAITLSTSGTGSISVGAINSSGGGGVAATAGANGGAVSITTADGNITTGTINTAGGNAGAAAAGAAFAGGNAGSVTVSVTGTSALRAISLGAVTATGGTGSTATVTDGPGGAGGTGGAVNVTGTAASGASLSAAAINTSGGTGGAALDAGASGTQTGGAGGAAAPITLTAKDTVTLGGAMTAAGATGGAGEATAGDNAGNGGAGAAVNVTSNTAGVALQSMTSTGGAAGTDNGGGAGTPGADANITVTSAANAGAGTAAGGDITTNGGAINAGSGLARLFTGSLAGSTGITTLIGSGSGHFRYNSDETTTNYTAAIGASGIYAIYREQPTLTITSNPATPAITYGSVDPGVSASFAGFANGDTAVQALSTQPTVGINAFTASGAGFRPAGAHTITVSGAVDQFGYNVVQNNGTLTVNKITLTGTAIASGSSIYGSTVTPGAVTYAGVLSGDTVTDTAIVNATNSGGGHPNAGTWTQSTQALGGGDAANYTLTPFTSAANYTINPLTLTGTAIATSSSTYGSVLSPGAVSFTNVQAGDTVTDTAIVNATNSGGGHPNAGTWTQSTQALGGGDAANYTLTPFTSAANYTINPLTLTGTAIATSSSTYGSVLSPGAVSFTNVQAGDTVTDTAIVNTTGNSTGGHPNVGTFTQSTQALGGGDAANYTLTPFTSAANYTINPLTLTGTAIATSSSTYGSVLSPGAVSFTNVQAGDTVTDTAIVNATNSGGGHPNAGTWTQSTQALGGGDAANYTLTPFTSAANYTINPLTLTGTAIATSSSTYGSVLSPGAVSFTNVQAGDTVTDTAIVNATNSGGGHPNAGTWTQSTQALGGGDAANYTLTPFTSAANYTINPLTLTGTAIATSSSTYGSVLSPGAVSFTNVQAGDTVTDTAIVNTTGNSTGGHPNVGTFTQSTQALGGGDAANYTLTPFTSAANYTINPLTLTGTAIATSSSTYGSVLSPGAVSFTNVQAGDTVTDTAIVNATNSGGGHPNAGTWTQSTQALGGGDAANYTLTPFTSAANYTINPLTLTGTAIATSSSTYGSVLSPGAVSFTNVQAGDTVTDTAIVNATNSGGGHPNAGTWTQSTQALGGGDAANYTLTPFTSAANYTINPLTLTGTAIATSSSTYGSVLSPGAVSFTNVQAGDTVTDTAIVNTTGNSTGGHPNVGTFTQSTQALGGGDAANYTLTPFTSAANYTINPLALTGAAIAANTTTYASALVPGAVSFGNVASGDTVTDTATVNTTGNSTGGHPNVGTFTQTAGVISGADSANYTFAGFTSAPNYAITQLALTGAAIAPSSSIYASPLAPGAVSFGNVASGDSVTDTSTANTTTLSGGGFPIVGTYTQTAGVIAGADSANYSFAGFTSAANYSVTRLASVNAIASGNWSNPATWFGGAVPDYANVATVNLNGHTVTLDGAVAQLAGSVQVDNVTGAGASVLNVTANNLAVAQSMTVGSYTQNAGAVGITNNLTVGPAGPMTKTGGTLSVGGTTTINTVGLPIAIQGGSNTLMGPVLLAGSNATIDSMSGGLNFGTSTLTGSLSATTTNAPITESGPVVVNGTSTFSSGAALIDLGTQSNNFGGGVTASSSTGGVSFTDVDGFIPANINAGSGLITLTAGTINPGTLTTSGTANLSSNGNVTGLVLDIPNGGVAPVNRVNLLGSAQQWTMTGTIPSLGASFGAAGGVGVTINGVNVQAGAIQLQTQSVISSAQASAVSAAAEEAANTFGTDSVAEQIEFGFAGDVGNLPPMDHRLQGVGISVPKCFNESREGENC